MDKPSGPYAPRREPAESQAVERQANHHKGNGRLIQAANGTECNRGIGRWLLCWATSWTG